MTIDQLIVKQEIRELVDEFSILADNRDAKGQGPLFTEDAVLEFQMGPEGEVHQIPGRDAIVAAFENTVGTTSTAKAVYHVNGQLAVEHCRDGRQVGKNHDCHLGGIQGRPWLVGADASAPPSQGMSWCGGVDTQMVTACRIDGEYRLEVADSRNKRSLRRGAGARGSFAIFCQLTIRNDTCILKATAGQKT